MPEGDTIAWHARRLRPVLEGRAPDEIRPHQRFSRDRWPEKLGGQVIRSIETHGKHLFLRFEDGLALHSHLGMVGTWAVYRDGRRWGRGTHRAWLVLRAGNADVVQFDGSTLELITDARRHFDQRLAALGPDVLASEFDAPEFLRRLRQDDPTRPIGDALLDQRTVAGIGNLWKAEGCWEAELDPWRRVGEVSDAEVLRVIERVRPRMVESAEHGPRVIRAQVYGRTGQPCPRCGQRTRSRGQGDANRTTMWCPGCQR